MNIWTKWTKISLVKRILVGLIIGAILGVAIPSLTVISILGDLFVGALKALAPLLVFFIVMNSLAHHKKGGKTNMSTVVVLYLAGTFLAALCAVVASFAFPSTLILATGVEQAAPGGIGEVLKTLLMNAVSNPISSIANANYIGVLTWAVIFGLALRLLRPPRPFWRTFLMPCPPPSSWSSTALPSVSWVWCLQLFPPPVCPPSLPTSM